MVASLLHAELPGEALGAKERRQTPDDDALALGILDSAHLRICGRKIRMRCCLDAASGAAGYSTLTRFDRFAVAAEEIISDAQVLRCEVMGVVEAQRAFEPRHGFLGSACP